MGSGSIIWGTGIMFKDSKFKKPKKIISVRGPLTRQRCLELGYECPEEYGDIVLILPKIYNPKKEIKKIYKIGITPHYVDYNYFITQYKNNKNINIIDLCTGDIEKTIDEFLKCDIILSSSLHGIITSHAYNIKCLWIKYKIY